MTQTTYCPDAVKAIMNQYTPIEVKGLIHSHDESMFVHHQEPKDIVEFYAEAMAAYNYAQAKATSEKERGALQNVFLKDVVYIFIATVAYDLAASHDMIDMTMEEVENYQLSKDLDSKRLKLLQGGKA